MIESVDIAVTSIHIAASTGVEPVQRVFPATIVESLFGDETSAGVLLLVTSVLLWLGYLSLRISGRLRIPLVTAFLLSTALVGAAGALLGRYIGRIKSSSELSMFVLAHLLLTVAIVDILGGSVLLAGLTMGMVSVNLSGGRREREWLFRSLGPLEDPIIAVFFLWAGAGLHLAALTQVGVIALFYLLARALGKWLGPRLAAFGAEKNSREAWELRTLGFGLLPQAGAAIGLGILARDALPVAGEEILAVVLGTVIFFELTGPLAVSRAITAAGEATEAPPDQPM